MTDYSIWPATDGPFADNADAAVSLGIQFSVSAQAWVTALRYWRGTANVNPDDLRLWRADSGITGTSLASVVPPAAGTIGWQTVALAAPVELTPGQIYKTAAHFPTHYCSTGAYWTSGPGGAGITNGILTAQSDAGALAGQGTFGYDPSPVFPDGTFGGGNYWVDVVVTDTDPAGANTVDVEQALELDTGGEIMPVRVVELGLAAELDTAQQVTPVRVLDVGQALQTDTAGVVTPVRIVTVGMGLQADEALPVTPVRVVRVGQALELDSALAVEAIGPAPAASRGRLTSGTRAGPSITAPPRRVASIRGE